MRAQRLPDSVRRAIQRRLQDQGFYSGVIRGDFDRRTIDALEAYAR
jgi:peptidoglycan hydrolase-like protein with peptidoglycan-binding domain